MDHLVLVSLLESLIIFVSNSDRKSSATNLQCVGLEIIFKEFDIHRGRSHYYLEVFSFRQELFHKTKDDIDTNGPFVGLINDEAGVIG